MRRSPYQVHALIKGVQDKYSHLMDERAVSALARVLEKHTTHCHYENKAQLLAEVIDATKDSKREQMDKVAKAAVSQRGQEYASIPKHERQMYLRYLHYHKEAYRYK